MACTIQVRRFDTLLDALAESRGDAVIASLATTPQTGRERFHRPLLSHRRRASWPEPICRHHVRPESLTGRTVAVVGGSAHEAYLRAFFAEASPDLPRRSMPPRRRCGAARSISSSATASPGGLAQRQRFGQCCAFAGGPYTRAAISARGSASPCARNEALRRALDYALQKLWEKGVYTELYLRYFPVGFY